MRVSGHFGVYRWRAFRGSNLCAQNGWGTLCWVGYCEFGMRWRNRACHICIAFVSACFADRPGSAEIRGFRLFWGIIGAQRWRVSDAAKQTLRNFCGRNVSKMWIFRKFVWYPWFRTIFLHRMAFLRKKLFRCSRPRGCAQICHKFVFFGALFLFWSCSLPVFMMDGGDVVREEEEEQKKEKRQSMTAIIGFVIFVSFSFSVVLVQRFCFISYMLMHSYYCFLSHHSSFIIINTMFLFYICLVYYCC